MVVAHQSLVEPIEHRGALLAPQLEVARKTNALGRDIGAGLFEPQREATKLVGKFARQFRVVGRMRAVRVGALHQEGDGGWPFEHAEFELLQRSWKIARAAGDDDFAAPQARQQLRDGGDGGGVVGVVEDHQPAGMIFEPTDRGANFRRTSRAIISGRSRMSGPVVSRGFCIERKSGRLGAQREEQR